MLIGFKRMKIQPFNKEGKADGELIVIEGKEGKGATQEANISGLGKEPTKVYGSNIAYYISQKGVGDVTVETTILDMPVDVNSRILGYKESSIKGANFIGEDTEAPYCAITMESADANGDVAIYGVFKGKFAKEEVSFKTEEADAFEPEGVGYKFTAVANDAEGEANGQTVVEFFGAAEESKAIEDLVFRKEKPTP